MIPVTWKEFLEFIGDIQDKELDKPFISQYVKIPAKCMTSIQIVQYFSSDFQKAKIKRRCKWGDKEKYFLIWCVSKLMIKLQISIHELNQHKVFEMLSKILDLPEDFLLTKWLNLLNYKLQGNPWTHAEDALLIKLRRQYPEAKDWIQISKEFVRRGQSLRYPKQIRERFNNVINPDINKNEFNLDEILFIFRQAQSNKKNWAGISKIMPGRTDNQIKNIYNSIIRKISNEIGLVQNKFKKQKNYENKVDEQQILNLIVEQNSYDPILLLSIIEEKIQKKPCVKIESTTDNSQTIEPCIQGLPIQMGYPYLNYQYQNFYFPLPQFYLFPPYQPIINTKFNET